MLPSFILGGVKFEFLGSSDTLTTDLHKPQPFVKGTTGPLSAVYLVLHNQPMPIMHLFRCQLTDQHSDHRGYSWPMLLGRLAKGELIYPWVKSRYFKNQLRKQFSAARRWFHQWEYKLIRQAVGIACRLALSETQENEWSQLWIVGATSSTDKHRLLNCCLEKSLAARRCSKQC